jgi:hypothetical protein
MFGVLLVPRGPLATRFPALYSHCTRPQATVAMVASLGLDLRPRLTAAAEAELPAVLQLARGALLQDGPDLRHMASPASPRFSTRQAYRLLSPVHPPDPSSGISWSLRLPSKVKMFAYLADIDRLSSRTNLFAKSCAPSAVCAACPAVETPDTCSSTAPPWPGSGGDWISQSLLGGSLSGTFLPLSPLSFTPGGLASR